LPLHCIDPGEHAPEHTPAPEHVKGHVSVVCHVPVVPLVCDELPAHCIEPGTHDPAHTPAEQTSGHVTWLPHAEPCALQI